VSEKQPPSARRKIQLRAAYWYYVVAQRLTGLAKARADKRIKAAGLATRITNPVDGSILVLVPAGTFLAGSEKFPVFLPAYYIGLHEVTMAQYKKFIDATKHSPPVTTEGHVFGWNGNQYPAGSADRPVNCIGWQAAADYCRWAGLRLPTELEWEKAARGIDGRIYPWGDTWDGTRCRTRLNWPKGESGTWPVGSHPEGCSPWGIFDLCGNADEWCADWFAADSYKRYRAGDLTPPATGDRRVMRGGSYADDRLDYFRCDFRRSTPPNLWFNEYGFRVAKTAGH
jgi:formylglycine-generating enzyme